jgi:hypothetical protein
LPAVSGLKGGDTSSTKEVVRRLLRTTFSVPPVGKFPFPEPEMSLTIGDAQPMARVMAVVAQVPIKVVFDDAYH